MGRILNLFDDAVWSSLVFNQSEQAQAPAGTQSTTAPQGCCSGCEFAGLCDRDECAAKLYPIDAPFAFTLFPNLGAYVQFLKNHGWL